MSEHTPEMLELVWVYAAGGVEATTGECAAIRAHIAECPICQEEFRRGSAAAAAVGLAAAVAPPAGLRAKILASLPAATPRQVAHRGMRWYVPAALAAALLIAAGAWWRMQPGRDTWLAQCVPAAASCHANGVLRAAGGNLELQVHGLAALPAGEQYQAWMIMPGRAPLPEPVFTATRAGDGLVAFAARPVKGAAVALTVEPAGGSLRPTTKPFLIAHIE
jgi:anti-sigma-K factor RskA